MAAALSFYAVFSLPPLLYLFLSVASAILDPQALKGHVQSQISSVMGAAAVEAVGVILEHAGRRQSSGALGTLLGIAAILIGATAVFVQLQSALNRAWSVGPDPQRGGVHSFVGKRLVSFALIIGLALLLLISLLVSAAISAVGAYVAARMPGAVVSPLYRAADIVISLLIIGVLFALIFKFLPDALLSWRDVWVGGMATSLMFVLGKTLIGLYLANSKPGSAYGAAASLALLFLWIYYSSMILLFGAEWTRAWVARRGAEIRPRPGAIRLVSPTATHPAPRRGESP
jgi:membrane protein